MIVSERPTEVSDGSDGFWLSIGQSVYAQL